MSPEITTELFPGQQFKVVESNGFNPDVFLQLFRGKIVACIFRGFVPSGVCEKLAKRFERITYEGQKRRHDDAIVPATQIGTSHYDRPLEEYFAEVRQARTDLAEFFAGTAMHPLRAMNEAIAAALIEERIGDFRLAQHLGEEASECVVRAWTGVDTYALLPHEDRSQLYDDQQRLFEIQEGREGMVISSNICLQNGTGGNLQIFKGRPELVPQSFKKLGYPYSSQVLVGIESTEIHPAPGDWYLLDGRFIHGVLAPKKNGPSRITIAELMVQKNRKTALRFA